MATFSTKTLTVTIDAPYENVAHDLADPSTHPEWGTEFFVGPVRPGEGGEVVVTVPAMGGDVRYRVDASVELGIFDLYLAPLNKPFGAPLPVRLLHNCEGVDVLWTLVRYPGMPDDAWEQGIESMKRELQQFKLRHERDQVGSNEGGGSH